MGAGRVAIFSTLKAAVGPQLVSQRNALGSWRHASPHHDILLFGDDPGTDLLAGEVGAVHVPRIERSSLGTPRLSSLFAQVQPRAPRAAFFCYANADIIFTQDLAAIAERGAARFDRFVVVGQRWNAALAEPLDFAGDWRAAVDRSVSTSGVCGSPDAIDYFLFPRGLLQDLPPFIVGRPVWDNWLLAEVLRQGLQLIDATPVLRAVHQNHDYQHVPQGGGIKWEGPEADENRRLAHAYSRRSFAPGLFTIYAAPHRLTQTLLLPNTTPEHRSAARAIRLHQSRVLSRLRWIWRRNRALCARLRRG